MLLLLVSPVLATITWPGPPLPPPGPGEALVFASPVALDMTAPARRDVGRLRFLAGWSLASDDPRFGGLSAMQVEGGSVLALSDIGVVTRFPVPARAGRLAVRFDPLAQGPGSRARKSNRDTEALYVEGDRLWVGFERHNMIWAYRRDTLGALSAAKPAAMKRWGGNRGGESLLRLADGRFLVLAEGRDDGRTLAPAVLFYGDPARPETRTATLRYRRAAGYRATDAALLPDGRILILSRRVSFMEGFSARLAIAEVPARVGPATVIEGREIAAFASPLVTDNFEALSVTCERGRTIVWIASDDNFSPLLRTLLLKFELRPEPPPRPSP